MVVDPLVRRKSLHGIGRRGQASIDQATWSRKQLMIWTLLLRVCDGSSRLVDALRAQDTLRDSLHAGGGIDGQWFPRWRLLRRIIAVLDWVLALQLERSVSFSLPVSHLFRSVIVLF